MEGLEDQLTTLVGEEEEEEAKVLEEQKEKERKKEKAWYNSLGLPRIVECCSKNFLRGRWGRRLGKESC